jgi:sugar/nucleoside kinase (ribokinase family)
MNKEVKQRTFEALNAIEKKDLSDFHVVLLPDFFVDHFLYLKDFKATFNKINAVYAQGGGNLPGISQAIQQGGNAANTALALARLGVSTHLICRTDKLGLHLLNFFLGMHIVDLSRVKTDGSLAITTAFEFGKQHVNVMMGDTGSVADFSFDRLDEKDLTLISESDIVCVMDWNLNEYGTKLCKNVFHFAKKQGVKTFFDSSDPSPRKKEIPTLRNEVLAQNFLDIFGLNENELKHYSNKQVKTKEEMINAVRFLKTKIPARIDFHTADFSCSMEKKPVVVETLPIETLCRGTGAGDTWNAGNLFAELLGLEDDERLFFANTFAGQYISSSSSIPPTFNEICSLFL